VRAPLGARQEQGRRSCLESGVDRARNGIVPRDGNLGQAMKYIFEIGLTFRCLRGAAGLTVWL
jgi:hypothetical protein